MPKLKQIKQKITLVSKLKTENTVLKRELLTVKEDLESQVQETEAATAALKKANEIAHQAAASSTSLRRKMLHARTVMGSLLEMLDVYKHPEDEG